MKSKLFDEIKNKLSTDNLEEQKSKIENAIENVIDENSHYKEALRMDRLTNADSPRLEYILGCIIRDSTICSSLYDRINDIKKLSWEKICNVASSYRKVISIQEKKLDTSYKSSVLMASIIQNNVIEDEDKRIRLALDSALFYMCNYSVEYNSLIPTVQKKILYDHNIPDIENILKYIKILLNESNIIYENGHCFRSKVSIELVAKFEPLLIYIYKYLILQENNKHVICNIYKGANEYDEMFSDDKTKEIREEEKEVKKSNKGIARIFRRKK